MQCSLSMFTFVLSFVLPFWKLMVFEILFGNVCSQVETVLLDVLQLLMLLMGTMMYLEPLRFPLIILHDGTFLIIKIF
jgi:hypothetical protein